jgi:hypothetical protein
MKILAFRRKECLINAKLQSSGTHTDRNFVTSYLPVVIYLVLVAKLLDE